MTSKNEYFWFKVIVVCVGTIIFIAGFVIGNQYFLSKDDQCIENPLTYGLVKINEVNDNSFSCTCHSEGESYLSFTFDENGVTP